jgi:hypothetical protein
MRRSSVLSLPLQLVLPAPAYFVSSSMTKKEVLDFRFTPTTRKASRFPTALTVTNHSSFSRKPKLRINWLILNF